MAVTKAYSNTMLQNLFSGAYIGLSTTQPSVEGTGVTEPASGTGYARVAASAGGFSASNGAITNNNYLYFPEATVSWGTVLYLCVFEGSSSSARLRYCRLGKIDQILTKSISRFARNMKECIATIRKLKDIGVRVLFEKEGIDTMNMVGELFLTILAAMAEEESNSISQNVKWSRKRSYEMGRPIEKPSYGYRKEGREHHWVIWEPEAKRVRLAFYMAGLCRSNAEIREALNRLEEQEHTGKVWKQTPLMNLLTNYAYVGDYLSNKQTPILEDGQSRRRTNRGEADQYYISEHHEAIISHALFDCVQEIIASHLLFVKRSRFTESEAALMEQGKKLAEAEFRRKPKEELPWLLEETKKIL